MLSPSNTGETSIDANRNFEVPNERDSNELLLTPERTVSSKNRVPRTILRSGKRPPTKFIHSEDWSLYLRICCQLRHIKVTYECSELEAENILHTGSRDHSNRVIRLICAFNRLYAEYSHLSDLYSHAHTVHREPHASQNFSKPTNAFQEATVSSGWGDTKATITDVPLEQTGLSTLCIVQEQQDHQPIWKDHDHIEQLTDATQPFSSPHHTTNFLELSKKLSPTDISGSGRTVVNSTSTSLHCITNQAYSVCSSDASQDSLHSQTQFYRPSSHVCFRLCRTPARRFENRARWNREREALQISKHLEQQTVFNSIQLYEQNVGTLHEEYYDKINRSPPSKSVVVYQQSCHRSRVDHVVHIWGREFEQHRTESHNEFQSREDRPGLKSQDHVDPITVHLPIALELVLPTTQCKIEKIMQSCKYICDPLEVAAELRQLNYNTDACIAYFNKVQSLRDIMHEFLPRTMADCKSTPRKLNLLGGNPCGIEHREKIDPITTTTQSPYTLNDQSTVLQDLQMQLNSLKRLQMDASRRLARVRACALEMIPKLQKEVEDKLMNKICTILHSERLSSGEGSVDLPVSQMAKLVQENRSLKLTLRTEENRRKAVFNMMQEYLGNIRVYCRCRVIPHTISCIEVRSTADTVILRTTPDTVIETYKFDRVFDSHATQAEVYAELTPSVCSFMDGYNVCFLTYGGEASGKTYTLLGVEPKQTDTQGIAQRALRTVLSEREARSHEWNYHLVAAVVEIYNDILIDLLSGEKGISIRVESGPDRMLENLENMTIEQEADIEQLLDICRERRRTGRTALNDKSSRSHLIIFARLNARSRIHDTHVCSLMALSDLAGFEDIIKADTLMDPVLAKEAGYINRSLSALNRVLMCLRSQDPANVSYRDSKLTFLLKPFFTQSGKCILIVTIRTDKNNAASTQSTLRFARDSRGVNLGRARRQFNWDKLIDDMRTA